MLILRLAAVALAAFVLPDAASAALTAMKSQEATPRGDRPVTVAKGRFDLVGVHWRGTGRVELRARSLAGRWSAWVVAAPESEDGPDGASREARDGDGWRFGNPWWVGASDRLQVRTAGDVSRVRAWTVRSKESLVPLRRASATTRPAVVTRSGWDADESIRRNQPQYAPELRYAVVHHTAGANTYTKAQAPAVVRAIMRYHVMANGWNDIGYNFLVDRFGTVYEGRYGGIDANVIGAHAIGFNTGSVGIALIGTYGSTAPSAAAEKALSGLIAWRLDLGHVDPLSMVGVMSGGSPKFATGVPVTIRAVSGHRDVGLTACPGDALYGRLAALASAAAKTGLPKLYEPSVSSEAGLVGFHARLSASLSWSVTVTDAAGATVATGRGQGKTVDWTWDASAVQLGTYHWSMEAGTGNAAATAASGEIEAGSESAQLALADAVAVPPTVSPDGDGVADTTTISYRLTASATVSAAVTDEAGVVVAELEPATWRRAGTHTVAFDAAALPDGVYTVQLLARAGDGREATSSVTVTVTRTLAGAALTAAMFSPNGDGRADTLRIAFTLAHAADVTVTIIRDDATVAVPFAGRLFAGRRSLRWDGSKPGGTILDGSFVARIEADDGVTVARAELPFTSDTTAPRLRLVSRTPPRLAVSEAVSVRLRVNNGPARWLKTAGAGTLLIPGARSVITLTADARDAAGNAAATLRVRRAATAAK